MSELEQECLSLRQVVEDIRTRLLHANNELDYARSEGVTLRAKVSELEEQVEERGRMANDCLRSLKVWVILVHVCIVYKLYCLCV